MLDKEIEEIIKKLPTLEQRQYNVKSQLELMYLFSNKLGLFDAADIIKKGIIMKG